MENFNSIEFGRAIIDALRIVIIYWTLILAVLNFATIDKLYEKFRLLENSENTQCTEEPKHD